MIGVHSAVPNVSPSGRHRRTMVTGLLALVAVLAVCRGPTEPDAPGTWAALSAGNFYNCGLSSSGDAYCWGGVGGYFEMPSPQDSIIPNSAVPWRVPGEHRFTHVSSGALVMCALDLERRAFCWGGNTKGEVGDLTTVAKRGPSAVVGGFSWRTIDAGGSHVCGITLEGATYCWGNNFRGALGLGSGQVSGGSGEPRLVSGSITFAAVWAGSGTSCALTADGDAYCWGINDYGMLGDGRSPEPGLESAAPTRVVGGLRFNSLAIGDYNVCGLTPDLRAYCWGYGGVLGNGSTVPSSSPVPVSGDLTWVSLSVGSGHTCGLATDGAAYCWGNGQRGRFGTGDTSIALTPLVVAKPGTYVAITAGGEHTCAWKSSGTAFCWGRGDFGQLGHGFMRDELRPVQVTARE